MKFFFIQLNFIKPQYSINIQHCGRLPEKTNVHHSGHINKKTQKHTHTHTHTDTQRDRERDRQTDRAKEITYEHKTTKRGRTAKSHSTKSHNTTVMLVYQMQ